MKVLLTGGTGMLGVPLAKRLAARHDLTVTYLRNRPSNIRAELASLDLADRQQISDTIQAAKPELIIHAAAATDIEWCEAHPEEARSINAQATEAVAEAASAAGARLVYISTDYVFDGKNGNYDESDRPNPLNAYGRSKLDGEGPVLKGGGVVIRTNLFGPHPQAAKQSFISLIINNLRASKEVLAVEDQWCNPIYTDQAADMIVKLGESGEQGIFNLACTDRASRYEFAVTVCDVFGLEKGLVRRVGLAELQHKFSWKAQRPADTTLRTDKLGGLLKIPTILDSVKELKRDMERMQ